MLLVSEEQREIINTDTVSIVTPKTVVLESFIKLSVKSTNTFTNALPKNKYFRINIPLSTSI